MAHNPGNQWQCQRITRTRRARCGALLKQLLQSFGTQTGPLSLTVNRTKSHTARRVESGRGFHPPRHAPSAPTTFPRRATPLRACSNNPTRSARSSPHPPYVHAPAGVTFDIRAKCPPEDPPQQFVLCDDDPRSNSISVQFGRGSLWLELRSIPCQMTGPLPPAIPPPHLNRQNRRSALENSRQRNAPADKKKNRPASHGRCCSA